MGAPVRSDSFTGLVRSGLAKARGSLRPLSCLWARPSFAPSYRDEALARLVERSPNADRAGGLRGVPTSAQVRRDGTAPSAFVDHFDALIARRWFADPRALLRDRQANEARLPGWLDAAGRQMIAATSEGLVLPGGSSPLLRAGFPWSGDPAATRPELLFAIHAHRFAFAPRLALAVAGGAVSEELMIDLLNDWMRYAAANPSLPFFSNLVAIQRTIASTWAFAFLGSAHGELIAACRFALLKIIAQDVAFLVPRLGDSFPNNHLLVDRFAQWLFAVVFPELLPYRADAEAAEARWLAELRSQTYADGGSVEHSVHYHGLACEMAAAHVLLSRAQDRAIASGTLEHCAKLLALQSSLAGADGLAPSIGDSSDDPLFPLDGAIAGNAAAIRELHRALFVPQIVSLRSDHPAIERAFWLTGGRLAPPARTPRESAFDEFPQSGLAVFSDDADATRCVFRTGPAPGSKVLPGHMHSDLLSVTLTLRGSPILVDAGTFTYRFRIDAGTDTEIAWRAHFAGPRAHNGLVVDGADPIGALSGNFRATADLPLLTSASGRGDRVAFVEASLAPRSTFCGFRRGVIHLNGVGFIVYDFVHGSASPSRPKLAFQLAAGCALHAVDDTHVLVRSGPQTLSVAHSSAIGPREAVVGRETPTNGWVSPRYGERVPAPQLLFDIAAGQPGAFALYGNDSAAPLSIECRLPTPTSRAFKVCHGGTTDIVLLNVDEPHATVEQWGVAFSGRLGWLRIPDQGSPVIRCLDGRSLIAPAQGLHCRFDDRSALSS